MTLSADQIRHFFAIIGTKQGRRIFRIISTEKSGAYMSEIQNRSKFKTWKTNFWVQKLVETGIVKKTKITEDNGFTPLVYNINLENLQIIKDHWRDNYANINRQVKPSLKIR